MPSIPSLDALLESACAAGTTPGAACVVLHRGQPIHRSFHGITCVEPPEAAAPVGEDTLFDVASLTKVMATTAVAMRLHADGLSLSTPVSALLPGFARGGKEGVTLEDLLAHRSGLPAWRPYWRAAAADPLAGAVFARPEARPRGEARAAAFRRARFLVREAVLAEVPEAPVGARAVYSDPGFMTLGWALEAAAGADLASLFARRVAAPLGLTRTRFVDEAAGDPRPAPVAATRRAVESRQGATLLGEVDDDNAFALGGVAGHAGLFSDADETARFGEAVRRAFAGDARGAFAPSSVRRFLVRDARTPGSTRALGFDTPSAEGSHAGALLSREASFGHLGFTGCSLWIDLSRELVVALLTDRVHASDDPGRIRALRATLHDRVAEHLSS